MACSSINKNGSEKNGENASDEETLVIGNNFIIVSSSVTVLFDKHCDRASAIPCSLSTLRGCSKCGNHTLQSTWKPLTAVLHLNSESPRSIDRAPAIFDLHIHHVAVRSIRTGEKFEIHCIQRIRKEIST